MAWYDFLTGTPEKHERVSTLTPEQEQILSQGLNSIKGRGAGGAFGESSDYWRDILSNNPELFEQFAAPEMRRFNEQTIPGLSEQFAGMGSGGLSSSGFRNAAVGAGADLSERLGAIRAGLKNQAAQGLQNMGQIGLGNYSQDVMTQPGTEGLLSQAAPMIGSALGSFAGPLGTSAGGFLGNAFQNSFGANKVGKNSSPYGGLASNAAQQSGLFGQRR